MNPPKKLTTRSQTEEQQQAATTGETVQSSGAREFPNVEEMLRHDAMHTVVPPSLGRRLDKSLAAEPPAQTSWWQRLFGKGKQ